MFTFLACRHLRSNLILLGLGLGLALVPPLDASGEPGPGPNLRAQEAGGPTGAAGSAPDPRARAKAKKKKAREKARQAKAAAALRRSGSGSLPGKPATPSHGQVKPGVDLDFTGLNLGGMVFTGVDLHGARLFGASTFGAVDLDLTGAEIHPFFEVWEDEKVGTIKYLETALDPHAGLSQPRNLVCAPGQFLAWLTDHGAPVQVISPTGALHHLSEDSMESIYGIQMDSADRLWVFGDTSYLTVPVETILSTAPGKFLHGKAIETGRLQRPRCTTPGLGGEVWVAWDKRIKQYAGEAAAESKDEARDYNLFDIPYAISMCSASWNDLPFLYFIGPAAKILYAKPIDGHKCLGIPMKEGCPPFRLASGKDGEIWFTLPDSGEIGRVHLGQAVRYVTWPSEAFRDPRDIVRGPDGNMWYTDTEAGRIGQVTQEGAVREFPLPPGLHSEELVCGLDGLHFTLRGTTRIGFIRAVPRPPTRWFGTPAQAGPEPKQSADAGPAASVKPTASGGSSDPGAHPDWSFEPYRPKPEAVKTSTGTQRREQHFLNVMKAEQRSAERAALKAQAAGVAVAGPASTEEKKTVSRPGPLTRLRALRVELPGSALTHICDWHGAVAGVDKSQFDLRFRSEEALADLIASGIEQEYAVLPYVVNSRGQFTVCCTRDRVGRHWDGHGFVDTDKFLVITTREGRGAEAVYTVVNAFPVSPFY